MTSQFLLTLLDEAFDKRSWHGPNLRASLRGVTAADAAWRPRPAAHNIWELALHAAYWKYVVLRKVTGAKRGGFPLPGSNFFPALPAPLPNPPGSTTSRSSTPCTATSASPSPNSNSPPPKSSST